MKFGLELECYNVNRSDVVMALTAIGINARIASYQANDYSVWQIKTDGSIRGDQGFEVVSPVLNGEEGIAEARRVVHVIKALGAKVNDSCGLHIHHDVRNWKIAQFRNLFKRFVKYENAMDGLMNPNRRGNRNQYIKSMLFAYGTVPATSERVLAAQKETFAAIDSCKTIIQLSNMYNHNRYHKLNMQCFFRQGTVEFRHHHGTLNVDVVERYIRLTAGMVSQSSNNVAVHVYKEAVDPVHSVNLMMRRMAFQKYIPQNWATAIVNRAKKVARQELVNA